MTNFLFGVFSSLAATVLTITAGWFSSHRIRRWAITLLSRMTGIGVERIYPQQKVANADLSTDLARAKWVKVLTGRGNELTRDSFTELWRGANVRLEAVQILLPDPGDGVDSWLAERAQELIRLDAGLDRGLLAEQVKTNIQYVTAIAAQRREVALRLYDLPNLCRVIATDQIAYLTLYSAGEHGRNSPCLVFRNPSLMYDFALRIFTTAWDRSKPSNYPTGGSSD